MLNKCLQKITPSMGCLNEIYIEFLVWWNGAWSMILRVIFQMHIIRQTIVFDENWQRTWGFFSSRTRSTNGFLFCLKSGPKKVFLCQVYFPLTSGIHLWKTNEAEEVQRYTTSSNLREGWPNISARGRGGKLRGSKASRTGLNQALTRLKLE